MTQLLFIMSPFLLPCAHSTSLSPTALHPVVKPRPIYTVSIYLCTNAFDISQSLNLSTTVFPQRAPHPPGAARPLNALNNALQAQAWFLMSETG